MSGLPGTVGRMTNLKGKVALVAGASRAAGRAIAVELARQGATVYATGRTTREQRSEMNRPETIEETAELATAAGGTGIPVQVDHLDLEQAAKMITNILALHYRLPVTP